ncbi:MAG: sulfotransferase [Paracoccaceae bacterium]
MAARPSTDATLRRAAQAARKGRLAEATGLYREVLARFPKNRRALEGLAALGPSAASAPPQILSGLAAQAQAGKLAEAWAEVKILAAAWPDDAALATLAGGIAAASGLGPEAETHSRRALALAPDNTAARYNLGLALQLQGRAPEAIAAYEEVLQANPHMAEARNNLGALLRDAGRHAEAAACFDRAVADDPGNLQALANLGLCQRELGQREAALASFRRLLDHDPDNAPARQDLALLHRFAPEDPELAALEAHLARCTVASDRARLLFARAKALDELDRRAEAFADWEEANRLRKAELGYDIAQDRRLFAAIRARFDPPPEPLSPQAPAMPRPVFILGMPRSGTTLAERILARHPQVQALGELNLMTEAVAPLLDLPGTPDAAALGRVRDSYLAGLVARADGRPVVTDKMPLNFRWIGAILTALPEARVVHMRRDPRAVGFSLFRQRFTSNGNGHAYDLADIAAYIGLHDALMAHWQAAFPGRIFTLDYEALTEAPEHHTRALLEACGLGWDAACLSPHEGAGAVSTASGQQVRRRIYRGSSGEWRRYEDWLAPANGLWRPG